MNHLVRAGGPLLASFILSGCCTLAVPRPSAAPRHPAPTDLVERHPLSGRIWDVSAERFMTPAELDRRVLASPILVLGERHDHPGHHRRQAALLDLWLSRPGSAQPQVLFEMLDADQRPALSQWTAQTGPESLARWAAAVDWDDSGWPDFAMYEPLFAAIAAHHAQPLAGHPSRSELRRSMAAGRPTEADLKLQPAWPADLEAELAEEIRQAHCGHAPPKMVSAMVRAQHFKDAYMAREIARAAHGERQASGEESDARSTTPSGAAARQVPVALVAGNGHVRVDRAVPAYLRRHALFGRLSVAFVEVQDGLPTVGGYDLRGAADVVIFTERLDNRSACDVYRQQLQQLRSGR